MTLIAMEQVMAIIAATALQKGDDAALLGKRMDVEETLYSPLDPTDRGENPPKIDRVSLAKA